MSYAEVNGSTVIEYPYTFATLQAENPYTDFGGNNNFNYWFPLTEAATVLGNELVYVRQLPQPTIDPYTQNVTPNSTPELIDGEWFDAWTITEKTPEEIAAYVEQIKSSNKQQAENLLTATDWTAIPSVSDPAQSNPYLMNQDAFLTYRSEVRDIAVNPPSTPVTNWPVLPAEVWSS